MCKAKDDFVLRSPRSLAFGLGQLLAVLLPVACLLGGSGCDRTGELAETKPPRAGHLTSVDSAAEELLQRCAAAYARLDSYSDAGRVVLTYRVDGETTQDVAPLAVAFERPNRLGIKAYRATAGVTENRFRMRLTSDKESPLRSQVVSRSLPERLDLSWLLLDPVAAEHLAAGLGGPPPQLDLLLGSQPFRAFVDGATVASLDGQGSEHGRSFHIIKIMRGEAKVRLWIDSQTSLLRRVELPTANLPPAMLADPRISDIHLSIELDDPQPGAPVSWSQWQVPVEPLDQFVRYFVAPPEVVLDPRLGKTVPAFRLKAAAGAGEVDTSQSASAGQIQLLVWLADHPSCKATVEQIDQALASLPGELRKKVAPLAIWAEPQPPAGTSFDDLQEKWHVPMPIAIDTEALGRDVLGVMEAPTIVVLDQQHRLQFFQERAHPMLGQALPAILERLMRGDSLATTMSQQAQAEQQRYVAQLWLARASDGAIGAFNEPPPYAPQLVKLEQLSRDASGTTILALSSDALHNLWLLTENGRLARLDSQGRSEDVYSLDWDASSAAASKAQLGSAPVRLAIDDKARLVAIHRPATAELLVLDTASRKTSTVSLGGGQAVVDFRWLSTAAGSHLAAITDAGRTVLIDPESQQQLGGQSPGRPVAVLEHAAEDASASGYVILSDGRIEPVIVDKKAGDEPTTVARPVSTSGAAVHEPSTSAGPAAALSPVIERQLKFVPAAGPWSTWQGTKTSATLARGQIARDEPAVFMLDRQLRQLWHAPLPLSQGADVFLASVADDPVSGQPLWAVAQPAQTLHLFRADGELVDHGRFSEAICGVALVPIGNELHLWLAHAKALVHYRLSARPGG